MSIATSIKEFRSLIKKYPDRPQLLAEGDSWFALPFSRNIIKQIDDLGDFNIMNLANSGDEAIEMMTWKQQKSIHRLLSMQDERYRFSALLFSGGGNDLVGPSMWHLLDAYEPDMSIKDCFNQKMLAIKLIQIEMAYRELIEIRNNLAPDLDIITHCYDRAIPSGQGHTIAFMNVAGPWLKPSLTERSIPEAIHQNIVDYLMKRVRNVLLKVEKQADHFHVVNSWGTIEDESQWDDELHPTSEGFEKIVVETWKPVLEELSIPISG